MSMKRRDFLAYGVAAGAAGLTLPGAVRSQDPAPASARRKKFRLHYAPHFGMFKEHGGRDPIDQIKFMADQGFTAIEDNWMSRRPPSVQEAIRRELDKQGMLMGVFVATFANDETFVTKKPDVRKKLLDDITASLEVAKRVGARWCTVVPGRYSQRVKWEYQTANAVDNLKRCCEICEKTGLVMVLEPLNFRNHPGLFLTKIPQAYQICKAVGHPSCKILNDLYHQQVSEGNLIPNIEMAWSEIAYFQTGDNPGRKEPTTGEINYRNVFKRIQELGFEGIIGMEHGNSKPGKEGEQAVIDAYRWSDDF